MKDTFYIVQYNDRYGNGTDKKIECIVKSSFEFRKWLEEHNEVRVGDGNEPENEEEFDLIEVKLFKPNLFKVDLK